MLWNYSAPGEIFAGAIFTILWGKELEKANHSYKSLFTYLSREFVRKIKW